MYQTNIQYIIIPNTIVPHLEEFHSFLFGFLHSVAIYHAGPVLMNNCSPKIIGGRCWIRDSTHHHTSSPNFVIYHSNSIGSCRVGGGKEHLRRETNTAASFLEVCLGQNSRCVVGWRCLQAQPSVQASASKVKGFQFMQKHSGLTCLKDRHNSRCG